MNWCNSCGHVFDGHLHLPDNMEEKMKHVPQRNFLAFILGLLEDAQQAFVDERPEIGFQYVEDAHEYMAIFLDKSKGE